MCSAAQWSPRPADSTPLGEDGDSESGDLIEDSEAIQPGEAVSFTLLQGQLHSVLGTLSEREAGVVSMRFGLTGGQPKTLGEIGKVYGLPGSGSGRSSPRRCRSRATRPDPRSSGTTSTDLTGGCQPQDVTSDLVRPARGRTECPNLDGQRRNRHRAEVRTDRRECASSPCSGSHSACCRLPASMLPIRP
jgi:Sigma-70, region 4